MSQATTIVLIAIPAGVAFSVAVAYAASAPNSQVLRSIRFALICAVIATFVAIVLIIGLRLNFTSSMPLGIYRIDHAAPSAMQRGMLVAVCAPVGAAEQGRRRGYLATGTCSGDSEPLLKTVAAVAGDTVTIAADGVSVNGHLLRNSKSLAVDSSGRPMTRWPTGRYRISRGSVWLYANDERSWDSRYWGPVPSRNVLASVAPVVVIRRH
jgi:conjugative transfer signal peptidase TraF